MKNFFILLALSSLVFAGSAQQTTPKKPAAKSTTAKKSPTPAPKKSTGAAKSKSSAVKKDPKGDLEKALEIEKADEKITALRKFLADHPQSDFRPRALESLTAARVASAEAKFESGERDNAMALYRAAIKEAPLPYPERLFNEVISKAPTSLFFRGEVVTALEIAKEIETHSSTSVTQLLSVAGFYLLAENGDEAKRIAETALRIDERSAAAYVVVGMANRLNFDPATAAASFAKAMELDPESLSARRSLADMKRALGKPDEALALYDELLAKDAEDFGARNGRILSLFSIGKKTDAESELAKAIEANPSNVPLLAGAAYWYAANGESTKAIDHAGKALATDPRYIWSHIALARALLSEGRFSDAEQVLLKAKKYGNFPTLEYEIASTKLAGGFYREAAEELAKSFSIKDGNIVTRLGRRLERSDRSFIDLLSNERTSSFLEPRSADSVQNADALKALLEFKTVLSVPAPEASLAADAAEAFAKGTDKMRYHRQIFAANELLEKKVAIDKAVELSRSAVASVDEGLSITQPAAPIMAGELYESRISAINADKYLLVPDVPKQTLSAIARGRIEEIAGWALFQQGEYASAALRFRRAVSILPEKSVWWRSSNWRLGESLDAAGNTKDAVDPYVKSYASGEPDAAKYAVIETAYKKVNGSTEGLEALIGIDPNKPEEKKVESPVATQETAAPETLPKKWDAQNVEVAPEARSSPQPVDITSDKPKTGTEPETKKPLFDPVVIEIKKPEVTEKKSEVVEGKEPTTTEDPKKDDEKPSADSSLGRPRLVAGKEVRAEETAPCSLNVSQETISLIGGGGSVGIIVTTDGDPKLVKAESSSPKDVEVVNDQEVAASSKQLLFVVRSLSASTNNYQVAFTSPCGKKEIAVKIR